MCLVCLRSYSLLWLTFTCEIRTGPSSPCQIGKNLTVDMGPRHSFCQENLGFS